MRKWFSLMLIALMLMATFAALAEEIDVTGFWYSEEDGDGIELEDGIAIFTDEDGVETAQGSYSADGANVTIVAPDMTVTSVVVGNSMTMDGSGKVYVRDGIEVGYWYNDADDSAIEFNDGEVWIYNEEGDVLGEGTYTMDGKNVIIEVDGTTMQGVIGDCEMTVDGVLYSLL